MAQRTSTHFATVAGLAAALSLAAVTPGSARWIGGHYVGPGVAVGAGAAALAFGAAAAAAANTAYGDYGGYGSPEGYYHHQPGVVVVAPGAVYDHSYYGTGPYETYGEHPRECRFSIQGC